jgi:SAM-dependent methyltransferase
MVRNINDLLIRHYVECRVGDVTPGLILDVGCGKAPYRHIYNSGATIVFTDKSPQAPLGLSAYVSSDAQRLPFLDGTFDLVVATEVLEHVPDPKAAASEITRVLRSGGRAIITVPFLYPLHEIPNDYHRFTPWSLVKLFSADSFVIEIVPRGGLGAVSLDVISMIVHFAAEGFLRTVRIKRRLPMRSSVLAWLYWQFWRRWTFRGDYDPKRRPPVVPTALERHTLGYLVLIGK